MTKLQAEEISASNDTAQNSEELSGSEILVRCLKEEGVKYVWGYPGGSVLYIYDALYKQTHIEHLLVRHEQAAVHAADGYARATGDVGVALVTSGPGATNAVTGIATAYMDSIPLVVITGQVNKSLIGSDAFQECDTVGITRPIVKHNILISDVKEIPIAVKKAFHIARTGRPGPVVIDIPKDISGKKVAFSYPKTIEMRSYNPVLKGHVGQIKKALQLLASAKRPYIYTGGGVVISNASEPLRALVKRVGVPVTSTLMGLGAFPASDPNFLGMPGMHGTLEANNAMQNCDVLLAIGARFDDRVIGNLKHFSQGRDRKVIHIDVDPSSISKRVKVDIPIVGDVGEVLNEMISQLDEMRYQIDQPALADWWKEINTWRKQDCLHYDRDNTDVVKPQKVIETLWEMTHNDDVYITSDVGQHQMWTAQFYRFDQPRRWINSGGLGTMGVGLPFAMGVQKAFPQAEVFCITGEGSIQMNIQELATCFQHNLPVKILSLNNRYLGMVRQWQELEYGGRYSHSYMESLPDFVKLAEAYGHVGLLVEKPGDIEGALIEARKLKDRTVFIDFRTDSSENVFPMVQAGKGITEMLLRGQGGKK